MCLAWTSVLPFLSQFSKIYYLTDRLLISKHEQYDLENGSLVPGTPINFAIQPTVGRND